MRDFTSRFFRFTDSWESNWIYSKHPGKEFGKFVRTAGKFYNDGTQDQGKCRLHIFYS